MKDFIQSLGFSESEAKMYLALLELGTAKVSQVTERAGLGRTLGYHVMDKLLEYGIVEEVKSSGSPVVHYVAKHPNELTTLVANRASSWDHNVQMLKEQLPALIDKYSSDDKPIVRLYNNENGLQESMQNILDAQPDELLNIINFSAANSNPVYEGMKSGFYEQRIEQGISSKILMVDTWKNRKIFQDNYEEDDNWYKTENYRWISLDEMPEIVKKQKFGVINIYNTVTLISVFEGNKFFAIEIDNAPITNLVKLLFEYSWEKTPPTPNRKEV